MAGIDDFLQNLFSLDTGEVRCDALLRVVDDLQDSTSPDRLRNLQQYVETLTGEINKVNRRRDTLGQRVANLDAIMLPLEEWLVDHPDDLEVRLLKDVFLGWRTFLHSQIEESRPSEKLRKRYDTDRKLTLLLQLRDTVEALNQKIVMVRPGASADARAPSAPSRARVD